MKKTNDIAYQNKDITSKMFAEMFPKESLDVYGIHLPKIVRVLPTNLPVIAANELRIDNLFELEDGSFAIIDYESRYLKSNKIKYLEYIIRILKRYIHKKNIVIRMIVLYTADVEPEETNPIYDIGVIKMTVEQAFLSKMNSAKIRKRLTDKIKNNEMLSPREMMEFIILPLTYKGKEAKKETITELFHFAKEIEDEKTQIFLLTGMMVFSDKIIDDKLANQMKGWIMMTKVARLFEIEKEEAVKETAREVAKEVAKETTKEVASNIAFELLKKGNSIEEVISTVKMLTPEEIQAIADSLEK